MPSTPRALLIPLLLAALLAGCGKPGGPAADAKAPQALLVTPEDVVTLGTADIAAGPVLTGSVQPERRADLRAEVSAVVMQVLKENGDVVRRGDLLVRLDDTAIRDALTSAELGARAAQQAFEQAERQLQRMKTLRQSGMASAQQLDDAEVRRNNAQSDAEAARARAATAKQQLGRTEVRAPFDGVVSDRKVSAGDTAQIGKELLKVIDPASMRVEGMISADQVANVKAGQPVTFRVNGYGEQQFNGKVRRVSPSANATTRQVEVLVDFTEQKQPKLAGLYAEGRVETESSASLVIPPTAFLRDGDKATAWKIKDNVLQKADITLGERDPRTGQFIVKAGLASGDKVIRFPTGAMKAGQKVETASTKPSVPAGADKPAPQAADAKPADGKSSETKAADNKTASK